ncbi:hypothetical protein [uncultured Kordia sp.]|uniref:hypothetical protein n=1 Tax=uncultured Kordia sp. TaxID=507699 RepID=UPI00260168D9|nr:hypothetical protein [uncultured Kordia sp.]
MYHQIDVGASIKKEKLVFERETSLFSFIDKFSRFFLNTIFISAFPFISIMTLIDNIKNNNSFILTFLSTIISIVISFYILFSLAASSKLKRIIGISGSKNRTIIKNIKLESNWEIQRHNQEITVFKKKWTWTSTNWGRQLFIIYDGKDILINCTTFGKYDAKSPFHWFSSRKIEKQFQRKFQKYIRLKH